MNSTSLLGAKVLGGLFAVALSAWPQAYTISAKPGAVNYIEGDVNLDGISIGSASLKSTFLNAGSLLETHAGKVEILLTPGVFLRVGENSRIRMLKASLVDTQIAVEAGESMIEVDQFVKESQLTISMRGGLATIEKIGLYRFIADGPQAAVDVIDGKAQVTFGEKHASLNKGREALLSDELKTQEFDKNREDELFAWSNIRSQYNASLTYQAARNASNGSGNSSYGGGYGGGYGGYGYGGFLGQGWYWNNGFNSWLWMPNNAFYSPFGWGFYGPGYVMYAPVVTVPVLVAGGGLRPVLPVGTKPVTPTLTVPVGPKMMPAIGVYAKSPAALQAASAQSARTISSNGGLRTYSGAPAARSFGPAGGGFSGGNASGGSAAHSSGASAAAPSMGAGGGGGHGGGGHSK